MPNEFISHLLKKDYLCYLDYHFAKFATGLTGHENTGILLAAALVSKKTREGHICINLDDYDNITLVEGDEETRTPFLKHWLKEIKSSPVTGNPGEFKPLILDEKNRLYLYRYWAYENKIAQKIKQFIEDGSAGSEIEDLPDKLNIYFPPKDGKAKGSNGKDGHADLQKLAAFTAVIKKLAIISGGPGTGKTTTVAKILALLLEQAIGIKGQGTREEGQETGDKGQETGDERSRWNRDRLQTNDGPTLRIKLAAPTGKAAARLQESIKNFKTRAKSEGMEIDEKILDLIPEEASTIHRLLGSVPNSPYFRHNSRNPLALDVLVVDEASMIDVPLMAKLLEALPEDARLIILGDKDQLSSVEAGKFMGDVCMSALESSYSHAFYQAMQIASDGHMPHKERAFIPVVKTSSDDSQLSLFGGESGAESSEADPEKADLIDDTVVGSKPSLRDCFIHLTESYRFDEKSGIGNLSKLVNEGRSQAAAELLNSRKFSDISLKNISTEHMLEKELKEAAVKHYEKYLDENDPVKVFRAFDQFRVLCAMREGPFGVNKVNMLIELLLRDKKLISGKKDWYRGMPVMITQNNYSVNLFNGDVGIVLPDKDSEGKLKAFFPAADGTFRKFHQLRLPEYEKVYAMTVHKSQGSEFDNVVLILPDKPNPVLTRELLYTGLTRAKSNVEIWSSGKVFSGTIEANIRRNSGLYEALCV